MINKNIDIYKVDGLYKNKSDTSTKVLVMILMIG